MQHAIAAQPKAAATEPLERTDARKRKQRRKTWRDAARKRDRRQGDEKPAERRRRTVEHVLRERAIQPGTLEAFELLTVARDAAGRRLLAPAAVGLLRSYLAGAEPTAGPGGWLCVPPATTQRQRADELDYCDRQLRNWNRDLVAAGFLRRGALVDAGDGTRGVRRSDGGTYIVTLKRRVWWVAPIVPALLSKAGNGFPAALITEAPPVGGAGFEISTPPDPPLELISSPRGPQSGLRPRHEEGGGAAAPVQPQPSTEENRVLDDASANDSPTVTGGSVPRGLGAPEGGALAPALRSATGGATPPALVAPSVPNVRTAPDTGGGDLQAAPAASRLATALARVGALLGEP
jgi:hypothetical protein